jgi:hypothetical protein
MKRKKNNGSVDSEGTIGSGLKMAIIVETSNFRDFVTL